MGTVHISRGFVNLTPSLSLKKERGSLELYLLEDIRRKKGRKMKILRSS
jgi:hypothetical protein